MNRSSLARQQNVQELTIFVSKIMAETELNLQENCLIEIKKGIISKIHPDSTSSDAEKIFDKCLAIPGFINPHLHSGDSIAKDVAYGLPIDQTVGKNGIKHQWLSNNKSMIQEAIENTIQELRTSGTTAAIEIREGGKKGVEMALAARRATGYDLVIYGRPDERLMETEAVINSSDGFGLNTTTIYSDEELVKLSRLSKRNNKKIAIHCMETVEETDLSHREYGKSDLERAMDFLEADFLIHMTYASENDLERATGRESPVKGFICCPRSNAYFGERLPPVDWFMRHAPERLCLGTDNLMTTPPSVSEELYWTALQLLQEKKVHDCRSLLKLITSNPARLFQLETGIIAPGYRADFNLIDLNSPRLKYCQNLYRAMVFRLSPLDFVSW
ncbi:MAG: amidohydrolase family protein [Candidatus Hodarchaeales archaeon]|jgi:cytosine/adenosine deaminase-related metal-dependent hydrolase